jgi:hypothetical protein
MTPHASFSHSFSADPPDTRYLSTGLGSWGYQVKPHSHKPLQIGYVLTDLRRIQTPPILEHA